MVLMVITNPNCGLGLWDDRLPGIAFLHENDEIDSVSNVEYNIFPTPTSLDLLTATCLTDIGQADFCDLRGSVPLLKVSIQKAMRLGYKFLTFQ